MSAAMPGAGGRLVVHLEGNLVTTLELTQPVLSIGRTPDNGLSLPHPMVSRSHAELRLTPDGYLLTDVGSSHGTRVGSDVLLPHQPRLLAHGDVVAIGPFTLTFLAATDPATADSDAPPEETVAEVPVDPRPAIAIVPVAPAEPPRPPRETFPMPQPPAGPSAYLRDLPVIYQENDFLGRFLKIFETIWEPLESRQADIELYFDPATCPVAFLPWLASWLDMAWNPHWPEARARQLLAGAMETYRWRGTRYGLERVIEMHTGATPDIREDAAEPFVFRIRIPRKGVDRQLLEDVIQAHKPAHTGYVLELVD